jgi:hypothetical protein
MDKLYEIIRQADGDVVCIVNDMGTLRSYPLPHIVYHSPTGFECGYPGSGPADLALSILADFYGAGDAAMQARIHAFTDDDALYSMGGEFALTGEFRAADDAVRHHQAFKEKFIATTRLKEGESRRIDESAIKAWLLGRATVEEGVSHA